MLLPKRIWKGERICSARRIGGVGRKRLLLETSGCSFQHNTGFREGGRRVCFFSLYGRISSFVFKGDYIIPLLLAFVLDFF